MCGVPAAISDYQPFKSYQPAGYITDLLMVSACIFWNFVRVNNLHTFELLNSDFILFYFWCRLLQWSPGWPWAHSDCLPHSSHYWSYTHVRSYSDWILFYTVSVQVCCLLIFVLCPFPLICRNLLKYVLSMNAFGCGCRFHSTLGFVFCFLAFLIYAFWWIVNY